MKCCTLSSANITGAREYEVHHDIALEPLVSMGKIQSGKQNTVKCNRPNSATPIGANTLFLQTGSTIHHFQHFTNSFPHY
jgi:hypothetical protein